MATSGATTAKRTWVLRRRRRERSSAPVTTLVPAGPSTRAWRTRPESVVLSTSMRVTPPISAKASRSWAGSRRCSQLCTGLPWSKSGTLTR